MEQRPLGIFIDGQIISSPTVSAVISDSGIITGLSAEQAGALRRQLRAGALPIQLRDHSADRVAATLGEDSVIETVQAGLVAFLAIVLFMTIYYRLPGLLASLALVVYASVVMATFKLVPITLTLAGIAGLCALRRNRRRRQHPHLRAYEGRAAPGARPAGGDRHGLQPRLAGDPRRQRLDADHRRDPVVSSATNSTPA